MAVFSEIEALVDPRSDEEDVEKKQKKKRRRYTDDGVLFFFLLYRPCIRSKSKKGETWEKEEWELQLAVSAVHDDFYRLQKLSIPNLLSPTYTHTKLPSQPLYFDRLDKGPRLGPYRPSCSLDEVLVAHIPTTPFILLSSYHL